MQNLDRHEGDKRAGEGGASESGNSINQSVAPWFFRLSCGLLTMGYLLGALLYIGELPLLDPDEPRYAGPGRLMAEGGSWLVPEFNGAPRINKPPLFYWLVAISDKLAGGATETSSRLPSVVMGLAMLWGTIWLGRRTYGAATGLLAGVVLATTPLFMALSRTCITDMTLSTFMAGTLAWLMLGMIGLAPPKKAGWIAAFFFGFAVLTKATAAFAVLLVIVIERALSLQKSQRPAAARWLPWMLALGIALSAVAVQCETKGKQQRLLQHSKAGAAEVTDAADEGEGEAAKNGWERADGVLKKCALVAILCAVGTLLFMAYRAERFAPVLPPNWKRGLLLAVAMGLWWYVLLIVIQGWGKFYNLLAFEIGQRVVGGVHPEPMHFYLMILPMVTFPWSIGLIGGLGSMWARPGDEPENSATSTAQRGDRFVLAWVMGVVLYYSIPGAKLPTYILSAMPAVALLTARFIFRLEERGRFVERIWLRTTVACAALTGTVLIVLPFVFAYMVRKTSMPFVSFLFKSQSEMLTMIALSAVSAGVLFTGSWLLAVRGKGRIAGTILGCGTMLLWCLAAPYGIELMKQRSGKNLCAQTGNSIEDCQRLATLGISPESISYYLRRPADGLDWTGHKLKSKGLERLYELLKLADPELQAQRIAVVMEKRYATRVFGKELDWNTATSDDIGRFLKTIDSADWGYVFSNENVLVLRMVRKK